ncbi:YheC/YheD family protein [Paenibacillus lemnae]|uniref:YheC/YheD family protein n=1 Tax=Paenibacillus lemnae TaxID=1330551 RepID=A0A848M381_PAELE|nr:YheC/YheD family protein [Paenibacillus lemnae]NMO95225.1 YheC/YheD family protein [Paenibacillus lemnae]
MQPEYVGILLNDSTHRGIPSGKTGTESISNYEEAAAMVGLTPCYFRIRDISLDTLTTTAYLCSPSGYVQKTIPLPKVIHNRAIHSDPYARRLIEQFISSGIFIFNAHTRYGKDIVHHMLTDDPMLRSSLPQTVRAKPGLIRHMLREHGDVILKPCRGSVGLGIMRLRRTLLHDQFTYSRSTPSASGWRSLRIPKGHLPLLLRRRIRYLPFLVQERIPLAEYEGSPFDLRITVQRGGSGNWELTGMFARTTPKGTFVSNIAQGGIPIPVLEPFRHGIPGIHPEMMIQKTAEFGIQIAQSLSCRLPYAADYGIDAGVTADGRLFFIECNGRDQRYGFREAGMPDIWKESYQKPMAFARYLLDHGQWPPL